MVWYPSINDVIDLNIRALDLSGDRHPHKILASEKRVQAILDSVKAEESKGILYQAALIMKTFANAQVFAGANRRTGYGLAKMVLRRNGRPLRISDFGSAYPFIKNVGIKDIDEIREWIERGASQESQ